MNTFFFKPLVAAIAVTAASSATAQITFYEREGFRGEGFATDRPIDDFRRVGFNDRASSVVVDRGHWEVCQDARSSAAFWVISSAGVEATR